MTQVILITEYFSYNCGKNHLSYTNVNVCFVSHPWLHDIEKKEKHYFKKVFTAGHQWLTCVTLATWKAGIGSIAVQGQTG
jgi:hypothetical protein